MTDRLKDVVDAINNVKSRMRAAQASGDLIAYSNLVYDLLALENCLVTEAELLIKQAA